MSSTPNVSARFAKNRFRNTKELIIEIILFFAAFVSVATTVGIIWVLVSESIHFFEHVSFIDFVTDTLWTPLFEDAHYGIIMWFR